MDLLALADFNLVAAHGGFGRASRIAGRPKATLSRRVAELEESLGVRLIERGARSLQLTEAGVALHARTEALLGEIKEVGETIGAGSDHPRSRLRVSALVLLAHTALGWIAAGFVAAYPEVRLEITAEDRLVDPVEEGYDVVIRVNPAPDDRLVARCVLRNEALLVAPPSMCNPAVTEGRDAELPVRAVVRGHAPASTIWRIRDGQHVVDFRPDPVLRLSSQLMVRDAVLAGVGAGLLPQSMVAGDVAAGRLASWGIAEGRQTAVCALHTSRRLVSRKVTAFLSYLEGALPNQPAG